MLVTGIPVLLTNSVNSLYNLWHFCSIINIGFFELLIFQNFFKCVLRYNLSNCDDI